MWIGAALFLAEKSIVAIKFIVYNKDYPICVLGMRKGKVVCSFRFGECEYQM